MRALLFVATVCLFSGLAHADETWPADEGQPKINSTPRIVVGDCYDKYACTKGGGKNLGHMSAEQCDASAATPSLMYGSIFGSEACLDFAR